MKLLWLTYLYVYSVSYTQSRFDGGCGSTFRFRKMAEYLASIFGTEKDKYAHFTLIFPNISIDTPTLPILRCSV